MLNPIAIARISEMVKEGDTMAHHTMIQRIIDVIASREPRETDTMVLASVEDIINEMASEYWS